MAGELVIVEHGAGRGRRVESLEPLLHDLGRTAPDLRAAVRQHRTGGDAAPDLSAARAVLFWLGDPLRERYPDCFAEASAIAESARAGGLRLVNPPECLSNTIKSVQARLWRDAGLATPHHVPFADRDELETALATATFPLILRADRLHSQKSMRLCRTLADVRKYTDRRIVYPGALAEFVDTREGYRGSDPSSVWARFFHKKRALVLGDTVSPRSCLFSSHPIVGMKHSTYRRYTGRMRSLGLPFDRWTRRCVEVERAWWNAGGESHELLCRAAAVLGLGLVAIDYTISSDATVMLWEANPYFRLPPPQGQVLVRQRGFADRFRRTCRDFEAFVAALTGGPEPGVIGRSGPGAARIASAAAWA